MKTEDLKNRFGFHPAPDQEKVDAHGSVRRAMWDAAMVLNDMHPHDCREKSLAITHLEDAMMWGNAALARHDNDDNPA